MLFGKIGQFISKHVNILVIRSLSLGSLKISKIKIDIFKKRLSLNSFSILIKGWYTYAVHFDGEWGVRQKWILSDVEGWGVSECSGRPIFIFYFIKENWICAMTRHHAAPNINILLTRSLPFESDVRQWSHLLMIPLNFLWAKWNNTTRGQFDFVRLYARCGCCSIVCLRFQVVQI